jgi:flavin reductase (DIM6/NTAB) family NADH-FMN oxidoreductase RutF
MSTERAPYPASPEREFRDTLAQFATGVTIVAARTRDGALVGLTASSFNSVSLNPPLIAWGLARRSHSLAVFEGAERYSERTRT